MLSQSIASNQVLAGQAVWLRDYRFSLRVSEQGIVVSVGDGIAWIEGLPSAAMDEILDLEDGSRAMVFQLEAHIVGAILLEQTDRLPVRSRICPAGAWASRPGRL
jgi:F-type H+/Na+-transporting ATPase subunit alpha